MVFAADLHCDVLYKMLLDEHLTMDPPEGGKLDVTLGRLRRGGVGLQVFAVFLPEELPLSPEMALKEAELFWEKVAPLPGVAAVRSRAELRRARAEGSIAALLSLEGVDGLDGRWWALRLLHRLGLRLLGMTWNNANWASDGALEARGAGLTRAGRQLVAECENLGILIDVSHLSERGFWDLADAAKRPFFASHSNARALRDHPRNLSDEQIRALVAVGGIVGVTFVPSFLTDGESATIDDVLRHVEHICALGGADHIAFGSDFDGIERHVARLAHPGDYPNLAEALAKRYPDALVRGFLGENAFRFLENHLPE